MTKFITFYPRFPLTKNQLAIVERSKYIDPHNKVTWLWLAVADNKIVSFLCGRNYAAAAPT